MANDQFGNSVSRGDTVLLVCRVVRIHGSDPHKVLVEAKIPGVIKEFWVEDEQLTKSLTLGELARITAAAFREGKKIA